MDIEKEIANPTPRQIALVARILLKLGSITAKGIYNLATLSTTASEFSKILSADDVLTITKTVDVNEQAKLLADQLSDPGKLAHLMMESELSKISIPDSSFGNSVNLGVETPELNVPSLNEIFESESLSGLDLSSSAYADGATLTRNEQLSVLMTKELLKHEMDPTLLEKNIQNIPNLKLNDEHKKLVDTLNEIAKKKAGEEGISLLKNDEGQTVQSENSGINLSNVKFSAGMGAALTAAFSLPELISSGDFWEFAWNVGKGTAQSATVSATGEVLKSSLGNWGGPAASALFTTLSSLYGVSQTGDWERFGLDMGGGLTSLGLGLAGAKVGALAGSAFGPVGTVVGSLVGGVGAAIGGRFGWKSIVVGGLTAKEIERMRENAFQKFKTDLPEGLSIQKKEGTTEYEEFLKMWEDPNYKVSFEKRIEWDKVAARPDEYVNTFKSVGKEFIRPIFYWARSLSPTDTTRGLEMILEIL